MMPSGVGRAHLTRLVLVARELRRRGVDVAFAFREADPELASEGFETFVVPEVLLSGFDRNVFAAYTVNLVEECVAAEIAAMEAFHPEVVVSDLRPSAAISTELVDVAHVTVVNGYLSRQFDPAVLQPDSGTRRRAPVLKSSMQVLQKRASVGAFRLVARRHGVSHISGLDELLEGDRTLIADLPEFCPVAALPPTSRFIGPLIWDGSAVPDAEAGLPPSSGRPLIYVTTGNTGGRKLVDLAIQAFADDDEVDVMITTGAYLDVGDARAPPHIRIERFVRGSMALARARLAVHCGGNGTTYQVVAHGRPAVVVPFTNDQRINAALVMRHRLGIALEPDGLRPEHLLAALLKVWRDADTAAALDRFQRLVTESDGPNEAASVIAALFDESVT